MSVFKPSTKDLIPANQFDIWYFDNGKTSFTVRVLDGLVIDHENESLESFIKRHKKKGFNCEHVNK
ncbi:MAG: hypothetical protein AAF363_15610 [Bacteroidota bacterium]